MVIQNDKAYKAPVYTPAEARSLLYDLPLSAEPELAAQFDTSHNMSNYNSIASTYQSYYNAPSPAVSTEPVAFESYIKPNDVPKFTPTFRPKMYDAQLQEVDSLTASMHLEKIAEVEVIEEKVEVERPQLTSQEDFEETSIRLNSKGVIVVATFVAVLVLITALIIINVASISASSSRISTLNSQNVDMSQTLHERSLQRDHIRDTRTADIQNQLENNNGNVTINGNNRQLEYHGRPPQTLPNTPAAQPPSNPDASTNWFDRFTNWLSNLFR